jgi:DNA-directed RNA polymerase specialized sigma subunit
MGRGTATLDLAAQPRSATPVTGNLGRALVTQLHSRVARAEEAFVRDNSDFSDLDRFMHLRERAREAALKGVSPAEQRQLVRIAREYEGPRQEWLREQARELLQLAHGGTIADMARAQSFSGIEDEVLRQRCREALLEAIDRYDFDVGANFNSYARERMRGAMKDEIRWHSRPVKFSHHAAKISERVSIALKICEKHEQPPTVENIAFWTNDNPTQIKEALGWLQTGFVPLDEPADGGVSDATIADIIGIEDHNLAEVDLGGEDDTTRVRRAMQKLSELERFVIEQLYGFGGEEVSQSDLYDGIYRDASGNSYTSERHIASAAKNAGRGITRRSREALLEDLRAGRVSYVPGNPRCAVLYELLSESGVPTTPAAEVVARLVANARKQIEQELNPVSIEEESAPQIGLPKTKPVSVKRRSDGRRIGVADLVHAGLVDEERLIGRLARKGLNFDATLLADGRVRLADGRVAASLSKAAEMVTDSKGWPGWDFWSVEREGSLVPLARLRDQLMDADAA